jgi:hypothetical protein
MSRMDSNNLYEEKRKTEASGCVWQNCWMPAWRAEFQSMNIVENLSSFCLRTKYDKEEFVGWIGEVCGVTPYLLDCDVWEVHL